MYQKSTGIKHSADVLPYQEFYSEISLYCYSLKKEQEIHVLGQRRLSLITTSSQSVLKESQKDYLNPFFQKRGKHSEVLQKSHFLDSYNFSSVARNHYHDMRYSYIPILKKH